MKHRKTFAKVLIVIILLIFLLSTVGTIITSYFQMQSAHQSTDSGAVVTGVTINEFT